MPETPDADLCTDVRPLLVAAVAAAVVIVLLSSLAAFVGWPAVAAEVNVLTAFILSVLGYAALRGCSPVQTGR